MKESVPVFVLLEFKVRPPLTIGSFSNKNTRLQFLSNNKSGSKLAEGMLLLFTLCVWGGIHINWTAQTSSGEFQDGFNCFESLAKKIQFP